MRALLRCDQVTLGQFQSERSYHDVASKRKEQRSDWQRPRRRNGLPWEKFDYNTDLGGYQLDVTEDQLKGAPTYKESERDTAYDRDYQTRSYDYWAVTPYW